mgnify:CR=1 FL=1
MPRQHVPCTQVFRANRESVGTNSAQGFVDCSRPTCRSSLGAPGSPLFLIRLRSSPPAAARHSQVEKVNKFTNKLVEEMRASLKSLNSKAEKETDQDKKDDLLKVGVLDKDT